MVASNGDYEGSAAPFDRSDMKRTTEIFGAGLRVNAKAYICYLEEVVMPCVKQGRGLSRL